MNYTSIKNMDIANGPGLRVSLFVSGCPHHCVGCFNAEAWRYDYGEPYTKETETKILSLLDNDHIQGLSLLGGEPLAQSGDALENLLKAFRQKFSANKDIWIYTGYLYEQVAHHPLLRYANVLVDGPFILEKKDPKLQFRGSSNQRIIDIWTTKAIGEVVLENLEDGFTEAK